jgi:hypothetical protein
MRATCTLVVRKGEDDIEFLMVREHRGWNFVTEHLKNGESSR